MQRQIRKKRKICWNIFYRQDRQNRFLTASEYAIEEDLYAKEAARLVWNLVKKGYLQASSKKGVMMLTENGYLKGIDCLARHEKLTQFFQMISGMTQEKRRKMPVVLNIISVRRHLKELIISCSLGMFMTEPMKEWICIHSMVKELLK